jgi:hypothetical protein
MSKSLTPARTFRVDEIGQHFLDEQPATAEEFAEARAEFDVARSQELVQARYLGDTAVAFPHLGSDAAVVERGDEFEVDRYSAEERIDLLCLHCEPSEDPTRDELLARARELGLDVKGNARKAALEAALAAHEAGQDSSEGADSDAGNGDEPEKE